MSRSLTAVILALSFLFSTGSSPEKVIQGQASSSNSEVKHNIEEVRVKQLEISSESIYMSTNIEEAPIQEKQKSVSLMDLVTNKNKVTITDKSGKKSTNVNSNPSNKQVKSNSEEFQSMMNELPWLLDRYL